MTARLWPTVDWLVDRLREPDFHISEIESALVLALWGGILVSPYASFAAPLYSVMAAMASQAAWGMAMLLISLATLTAVLSWRVAWRLWVARIRASFWLFVGLLLFAGNQNAVLPLLCFVFFLSATWSAWRLTVATQQVRHDG